MNGLYEADESVTAHMMNSTAVTAYEQTSHTAAALADFFALAAIAGITGAENITAAASMSRYIGES